jgi:hypothetical protein
MLQVRLLGGFGVERSGLAGAVSCWQRRSAKTLTKLLAAHPRHALHREQIIDILWPGADAESALNSFGKALHAARHAFEPELPRRHGSTYLRLEGSMLALDMEHVAIDADRFGTLPRTGCGGGISRSSSARSPPTAVSSCRRIVMRTGAPSVAASWQNYTSGCSLRWQTRSSGAVPTTSRRTTSERCSRRTRRERKSTAASCACMPKWARPTSWSGNVHGVLRPAWLPAGHRFRGRDCEHRGGPCQSLPAGGCPMSPLPTIDQKKRWAASLTARTWCRPAAAGQ